MSSETTTTWTCDLCGDKEQVERHHQQPNLWCGFSWHETPLTTEERQRWHLCPVCAIAIRHLFRSEGLLGREHQAGFTVSDAERDMITEARRLLTVSEDDLCGGETR